MTRDKYQEGCVSLGRKRFSSKAFCPHPQEILSEPSTSRTFSFDPCVGSFCCLSLQVSSNTLPRLKEWIEGEHHSFTRLITIEQWRLKGELGRCWMDFNCEPHSVCLLDTFSAESSRDKQSRCEIHLQGSIINIFA